MITGEKVIIKGLTKDCVKDIYEWVNFEDLRTLTGTLYPISEYEHEEWIKNISARQDVKLFLICDKESGINIGTVGLKNFDYTNRNAELYISIGNSSYISGGYGTDTVRTLIDYAFNYLNLHKIYLHVFESNLRAIKCYEKAGLVREGILLEHHFNNGRYENVIVMSKVSSI